MFFIKNKLLHFFLILSFQLGPRLLSKINSFKLESIGFWGFAKANNWNFKFLMFVLYMNKLILHIYNNTYLHQLLTYIHIQIFA